ncbi:MAG: phosphoesterase PA-phosphatase related protein [Gemmatimonadetes bacterium]|nr:phosphoesterase PA-phosphatase related protein [Gemmatimonadota bacterium]
MRLLNRLPAVPYRSDSAACRCPARPGENGGRSETTHCSPVLRGRTGGVGLLLAAAMLSAAQGVLAQSPGVRAPVEGRGDSRLLLSAPARSPSLAVADTPAAERGPLFTRRDLVAAGVFAGATVILFPLDRRIAESLQDSSRQASRFLHHAATGFNTLGDPGAVVVTGALYAVGRLAHRPGLADLGLHSTEAIVFASAVTGLTKGLAGRARPVLNVHDSRDFKLGRGFRDSGRTSFPSGHTTAAFAAASSVTEELAEMHPGSQWYAGPVLYGAAALVGGARMYDNKHWASDVVIGAAVGTFSGIKIVQYNHAHRGNRVDRRLLASVAPAAGGGTAVGVSLSTR